MSNFWGKVSRRNCMIVDWLQLKETEISANRTQNVWLTKTVGKTQRQYPN